ncbi:MAG: hypothetical protein APF83_10220 [Lutibacter sp. BRH_c52]|nr:MAG: hypothetical protein APF83_10220 [Lutibacter sp. BRH_c52]
MFEIGYSKLIFDNKAENGTEIVFQFKKTNKQEKYKRTWKKERQKMLDGILWMNLTSNSFLRSSLFKPLTKIKVKNSIL